MSLRQQAARIAPNEVEQITGTLFERKLAYARILNRHGKERERKIKQSEALLDKKFRDYKLRIEIDDTAVNEFPNFYTELASMEWMLPSIKCRVNPKPRSE